MPERPINFEQRVVIGRHLNQRRSQQADTLKLEGHSAHEEAHGQIVNVDGAAEPIILMSRYDPIARVRQNYVVASEKGLEWLEQEAFIEPEVNQDLLKSIANAD